MNKIECQLCGGVHHVIKTHLETDHKDVTLAQYQEQFPNAPLLSDAALQALEKRRQAAAAAESTVMAMSGTAAAAAAPASVTTLIPKGATVRMPMHEVFDLGRVKAAMSLKGDPVPISVLAPHGEQLMVPAKSDHYVYDIDELKNVLLAFEAKIPTLVWGHKGSGKSELLEQVCARTNRPMVRVQHTVNTEESHIVGQWTVKGGQTVFELGPLPLAMINGWVYVADEYDFGMPSVLAVYQAVLEGKSLMIKEAPADMRMITPHENFRFASTGNTNGSGDATGLYQGTLIQNSANYDRFGMVINKKYMSKKAEAQILQNHCKLSEKDADRMIEFATLVRQSYDGAKMSDTISPRTLIYASKIGMMRGSFSLGLTLSFINKLSPIDREVAQGLAQRIFGS